MSHDENDDVIRVCDRCRGFGHINDMTNDVCAQCVHEQEEAMPDYLEPVYPSHRRTPWTEEEPEYDGPTCCVCGVRNDGRDAYTDDMCSARCSAVDDAREAMGFTLFDLGCAIKGITDADAAWAAGVGK